jgi:hypothetical protein
MLNGKKRGQLGGAAQMFIGLIGAMFILVVLLFTGYTLVTSLNNANLTLIWNQTVSGVINFTAQMGTIGTIAGVMLLVVLIGGGILYGVRKTKGGGGTGF